MGNATSLRTLREAVLQAAAAGVDLSAIEAEIDALELRMDDAEADVVTAQAAAVAAQGDADTNYALIVAAGPLITGNSADIATNEADITTNAADIATNVTDISNLTDGLTRFWNEAFCSCRTMAGGTAAYISALKANVKQCATGVFAQACFDVFSNPSWSENIDGTNSMDIHFTYAVDAAPVSDEDIHVVANLIWRNADGTTYSQCYYGQFFTIPSTITANTEYELILNVPQTSYFDFDTEAPNNIQFNCYRNGGGASDTFGGTVYFHTMKIKTGVDMS